MRPMTLFVVFGWPCTQAAPQAVLSLLPYAVPVLCERLLPKEEGSKVRRPGDLALSNAPHALLATPD